MAPTGKEDIGVDNQQTVVINTETGPIQACCGFLLHSLSWLIIIFTFPFSICLCLKVWLQNEVSTQHIQKWVLSGISTGNAGPQAYGAQNYGFHFFIENLTQQFSLGRSLP